VHFKHASTLTVISYKVVILLCSTSC